MLRKIIYYCVLSILSLQTYLLHAQNTPLPFTCPAMGAIINEGPARPDHPSYLALINPSTGALGTQVAVTDDAGMPYLSLNGLGIVSTTGLGYAQHQYLPTQLEVILALMGGNYTSTSTLVEVGANGIARTLGTLVPPVTSGNAHIMLGLIGTADNSGHYLVAAAEGQVNLADTSVSNFKLYLGKVTVPDTTVAWTQVTLDASCTQFQQAFIDGIKNGEDHGPQDMVWDPATGNVWLYSGVDKIFGVLNTTTNTGTCYADNNGISAVGNLGGLALDSVGQLIGLEVQTGNVYRIDTRGCMDGNPATPCITSLNLINNYTINGNNDTRGDAASCVLPCVAPRITTQNFSTCVNKSVTLDIQVAGATPGYTYTWGVYPANGTLSNTTAQDAAYNHTVAGSYKAYVTVADARGCQKSDSVNILVSAPSEDTTEVAMSMCQTPITYNGQTITTPGEYLFTFAAASTCDSIVRLTVSLNCSPTPFACPVMASVLNEGPAEPEHPSYISIINPQTGAMGVQTPVTSATGVPFLSLNGLGIVNANGFGYAQHQAIPNRVDVITALLAGNYTSTSTLVEVGANGIARTLGTLVPPVTSGNAHIMLGLIGTADNSGHYLVAAAEGQVNLADTSVSNFKLYLGKVTVPDTTVAWTQVTLDASCTQFQQAFIDGIKNGEDHGPQDMVWDPATGNVWLYSGVDKIFGVLNTTTNTGTCYADNNGISAVGNLGGLALDSVGQLIGLEVQTGNVYRIDTRGCMDGNPATPCITSLNLINNYTINGNNDTRGDAASCVLPCVAPRITTQNFSTCVNKSVTLDIQVAGATPGYTYTWGVYPANGTLSNTTAQDAAYNHTVAGSYKAYVTVADARGCQKSDSVNILVSAPSEDTTEVAMSMCQTPITYNGQTITTPGEYLFTFAAASTCDSIVRLTVSLNCSPTPFACPVMASVLNEGPAEPEHPSYISIINPQTGAMGVQTLVTSATGVPFLSLNGLGIVNANGFGYAQHQAIPNRVDVITALLAGNYTSTSTLVEVGANGIARTLGTLVPPVTSGNAHIMLGLIGTADNSGHYLVAAAEGQVNLADTSVSNFKLYLGKVTVPDTTVAWTQVTLDASCTQFQQAFIDGIKNGEDHGPQDMVWDPATGNVWLYSGVDKIFGVLNTTTNTGTCYADNNGISAVGNLGGLALDSVGQLIGLEVQTGNVYRIDTRGCIDGNPATPCITSLNLINNYTINGNNDTRGDAASCVSACTPPSLTKQNFITCENNPVELSVNVSPSGSYTYTWGVYAGNGTLISATTATPTYSNNTAGTYKVYVTIESATGCQKSDSIYVTVAKKPDTTLINKGLCANDSILFNGQIIKQTGTYIALFTGFAGCDSLVKLIVTDSICNQNLPPVAVNNDTITYGGGVVIPVIFNDTDPDGDDLTLCGGTGGIITPPQNGTVQVNIDGTITYTPTITSGIDSFQYAICDGKGGADTAWVYITIEDCKIPNTFSPNGDGVNDFFEIPCVTGKEHVVLCVYNRWGAEVFRNENYDNVSGLFEGKYKGEDLPDGTYYYVLKYTNAKNEKVDKAGFVVIHRK